jgi:glycosyltransferase involved in cell wall biosynthesis
MQKQDNASALPGLRHAAKFYRQSRGVARQLQEIGAPGVAGHLHQHGNSQELAAAIIALIENPELLKNIGLTSREHVRLHYSRQRYADQMSTWMRV